MKNADKPAYPPQLALLKEIENGSTGRVFSATTWEAARGFWKVFGGDILPGANGYTIKLK